MTASKEDHRSRGRGKKKGLSGTSWQKLYDELSDEEKGVYVSAKNLLEAESSNEFTVAYQVGELIDAYDTTDEHTPVVTSEQQQKNPPKRKRQKSLMGKLSDLLGCSSATLYKKRQFYRAFGDGDRFDRLLSLRMTVHGRPEATRCLTLAHVLPTLDANISEEQRWETLELCVHNGWRAEQVKVHCRKYVGSDRGLRSNSGRPIKFPDDIDGKLEQIRSYLDRTVKMSELWTDPDKGLLSSVLGVPNEALKANWQTMIGQLEAVYESAIPLLTRFGLELARAKANIDARFSASVASGQEKADEEKESDPAVVEQPQKEAKQSKKKKQPKNKAQDEGTVVPSVPPPPDRRTSTPVLADAASSFDLFAG